MEFQPKHEILIACQACFLKKHSAKTQMNFAYKYVLLEPALLM